MGHNLKSAFQFIFFIYLTLFYFPSLLTFLFNSKCYEFIYSFIYSAVIFVFKHR